MKTLIAIVILSSSFFNQNLHAEEDSRDFGIRIGAGAMGGVSEIILKDISAYADMNLFNQSTRMIFGFSLYEMGQTEIPTMSIQSAGIEQNFGLPMGNVFLGILYNKTYLKKESKKFTPKHGFAFLTGYKLPLKTDQELVFTFGQQYQPLSKTPASSTVLDDTTWISKIAIQWYF